MLAALLISFLSLPLFTLLGVYAERKVSAFIQDRVGPDRVGYRGLLQTLADMLKLLQKEDIVPQAADRFLFKVAPYLVYVAVFSGFAVIPFSADLQGAPLDTGIFFFLAIVSLDVVGILVAGWGSNSKYALYGAMRSVAQMISYEIPLALSVLSVALVCRTLDLQDLSFQQGIFAPSHGHENYFLGIKTSVMHITAVGGFLSWNIFRTPFLFFSFIIFFIASLAEANRTPFDLSESESELVSGYHTEYSGLRWALFMLSEYGIMLLVSLLTVVLFLGSWNTPLPNLGALKLAVYTSGEIGKTSAYLWGFTWLMLKTTALVFLQMLIRWTYPRLRIDQLMNLCWKYLTPLAILLLLLNAVWQILLS